MKPDKYISSFSLDLLINFEVTSLNKGTCRFINTERFAQKEKNTDKNK